MMQSLVLKSHIFVVCVWREWRGRERGRGEEEPGNEWVGVAGSELETYLGPGCEGSL